MAHDEVLLWREGALGRVRLNRPRAINALTAEMVSAITEALETWSEDERIHAVALDGAGDRGLCAGADIRALRAALLDGAGAALFFLRTEYELNTLIARYPKPYLAWMDGIVMGGGIGLSTHGSHRLVTARTRVAMPETAIGFLPDVGALFPLSRAPGELGTHLALTGGEITGADAVAVGLADAWVPAGTWQALTASIADGGLPTYEAGEPPSAPLLEQRSWIDECYVGEDAAVIRDRLLAHPDPAARAAGEMLDQRSPLAVAVTLAAIRRAAAMSTVTEVLAQDLLLARSFLAGSDFVEGVRALLVDRDGAPSWQHADLSDVTPHHVAAYFG